MPGIAIRVQKIKKLCQPIFLAIKPVAEDASCLERPMIPVSRAYWVAVNFLLVMLAINATKAAVPIPLLKFSKAITPDSMAML